MLPQKEKAVLQWNCRGLKPNYEEIKCLLFDHNPYVICLQETLLKDSDKNLFKGYDMYNKTNASLIDNRPIGGSSILVKKGIPHETLELNTRIQAVAVKATLHRTVTICSIYIPPRYELTRAEMNRLVDQLPEPFLLLGDFNAHSILWGCQNSNRLGNVIESIIENYDLCLLNDDSHTYLHPASGSTSAIDLTLCSPNIFMDFHWMVHNDQCGSDHFPIFIDIVKPMPEERISRWQLQKANWGDFMKQCTQNINNKHFANTEDGLALFTHTLLDIASNTIPKSSSTLHGKHNPWFNKECKEAVKCRKRALRKFKKQPTNDNLRKYREARAKTRAILKKNKRVSWRNFVSKLNVYTSIKKVWDMVGKINGKRANQSISHLNNPDGSKCTEKQDIVQLLAYEFEKNSSSNHYSPTFKIYKTTAEKQRLNFSSNNTEDYNIPFSLNELKVSLNKCHDTATGPDDIHYQFLKHLPEVSLIVLLGIFNNIWRTGKFPESWCEATIIPIPKPGKDAFNPTNYRPISLTSCLCKTMERMINARLVWFLERNGLITKYQSGFRHNRSTTDQLIRLESFIRNGIVRDHHVVSVFFDLEKAYDTTWKYGILKDLYNFGLRGRLPIFIKNFLSDRVFKVRLGTSISELHTQEMGVPQGSILSVTLFLIKINSIVNVVNPRFDRSLFVDDFSISCSSQHMPFIETILQNCINRIEKWADENGFRFSKTKTVCVHFCNKRSLHLDPQIKINDATIPVVQQAKFLGLILDNKLNFKAHIDYVRKNCHKALTLLKVVSKMDWGADRVVLLRLYRSLVRSKLDYGCAVYGSARQSYLEKLKPIQNQGLRLCLGAFRTSPMESLYVEANEPPLYLRYEKLSLQYALKLKNNPCNPTYESTFTPQFTNFYTSKPTAIRPFGLRVKEALIQILNTDNIAPFLVPNIPPWIISEPVLDLTLRKFKKGTVSDLVFQNSFFELRDKYHNRRAIYTDGSKYQNKVGAAAVSGSLKVQIRLPDSSSIFTAELVALGVALDIVEICDEQCFIIFTDSLSSLTALQGRCHKHPYVSRLLEVQYKINALGKSVMFAWIPSHSGIKGNETADKLARDALNEDIKNIKIPYTDLRTKINTYIRNKWQTSWNSQSENKLYQHQPTIEPRNANPLTNRREDIVLTRARIGHSYLTHSYLLKAENPPRCIPCDCPLTVKHILLDCVDFVHIRTKYYTATDLKTLFRDISQSCIINYLKEIKLFALF